MRDPKDPIKFIPEVKVIDVSNNEGKLLTAAIDYIIEGEPDMTEEDVIEMLTDRANEIIENSLDGEEEEEDEIPGK